MPRIVALSDSHNLHAGLKLPDGDLLLHAGDFSMGGKPHECLDFLTWLETQPHRHKVFIAGNHDWMAQRDPDRFAALVRDHAPSCHYLNESSVTVAGLKVYGSPWTPTFYDWAFNADRGPVIAAHWAKIPDDTQVLVTHGPPADILDQTIRGPKVGCYDLSQRIRELKSLRCHTFGHIHYPGGDTQRGHPVTYVNASVVDERYRLTNPPVVVDL